MPASREIPDKGPHVLLVASAQSFLVRALPRLLARAGARISLASPAAQPMRHSCHVGSWIELPENRREWCRELLSHLAGGAAYDRIVVTEEHMVERFAREHPDLPWLPWPDAGKAAMFASRSAFFRHAAAAGLPVPPGLDSVTPARAAEFIREHGPSFLKLDSSIGGNGVHRVTSPEEAAEAFARMPENRTAVIQKECPGQVGVTEMIASGGKLLGWSCSFKHRVSRPNGASCSRRFLHIPGMEEVARKTAAATEFEGFCGFDWILSPDGTIHLLEFHPRPGSGYGLANLAGVDFPSALAAWLEGRVIDPVRLPPGRDRILHHFPDHLRVAWKNKWWRDLWDWIPFTPAASWATLPWSDPPLMRHLVSKLLRLKS